MPTDPKARFETLAIHAGQAPDPTTGAIMTPVYLTSTYAQASPGVHKGFEYSRTQNPTRFALRGLPGGARGRRRTGWPSPPGWRPPTPSLHLLDAGDHVLASDDVYGGTFRLFDKVFRRLGLEFSYVDMSDAGNVARALRPSTRLVWIETPTNPMLKLVDLAAVAGDLPGARRALGGRQHLRHPLLPAAARARHRRRRPLDHQVPERPLRRGRRGGVVVRDDGAWPSGSASSRTRSAACPSPLDSFLVLRGLKTLHVRMARHAENALRSPSTWKATRRWRRSSTRAWPRTRSTRWRAAR